jgi:pilus assembly protein CpaC
MMAGQTLALAGLIQTKVTAQERGIPYLKDLPVVGNVFGSTREDVEEVELLIMVTPEFAEAMDPCEVPLCGPGMETMSPSNCELYGKSYLEVPSCGPCGASDPCYCDAPGAACQMNGFGPCGGPGYGEPVMATDHGAPSGNMAPRTPVPPHLHELQIGPGEPAPPALETIPAQPLNPSGRPAASSGGVPDPSAGLHRPQWFNSATKPSNQISRHSQTPILAPANRGTSTPGLIGPIGYDVQK